jgi:hypothetical protein
MQNFVHKDCDFSRTTLKFSKLVISVRSKHTKRGHIKMKERESGGRENLTLD